MKEAFMAVRDWTPLPKPLPQLSGGEQVVLAKPLPVGVVGLQS